jgi:hypothetical protein
MQEQVTTVVLPEAAIALDKENYIRKSYLGDVNLDRMRTEGTLFKSLIILITWNRKLCKGSNNETLESASVIWRY